MTPAKRIALAVLVLPVLALTALVLWLQTGSALRWALAQAQAHTHGMLQIGGSTGSLRGPIVATDVDFVVGALHVHADRLELQWRPLAALAGRLQVKSAVLQGVQIRLQSDGQAAPLRFPLHPPTLPHLPVSIVLEDVRATDITFSPAATLPPVRIEQLRFAGRISNRSIAVRELELSGPQLAARGAAELAVNHNYALDASLDWRDRQPGWAPLIGHTELKGDARALRLRQTLAAPYGLTLDGELTQTFTAPAWKGTLRLRRSELASMHPGWPPYGADMELAFHGSPGGTTARGEAAVRGTPPGPLTGRFDVNLTRTELQIRALGATFENAGSVNAAGHVNLSDGQLVLTGHWQNLGWPLTAPELMSPLGEFALNGDGLGWRGRVDGSLAPGGSVQADFTLARAGRHAWSVQAQATNLQAPAALVRPDLDPLLPEGRWQLAAHGDLDQAAVDKLSGGWLGGQVDAAARYTRAGRRWQLHALLRNVHPERAAAAWPGELSAVVDANGREDAKRGAARTTLRLQSLHGTLRGSPLNAHGDVVLLAKTPQQIDLDARLGDDTLHLAADAVAAKQIHWQLDAPSLAQAWPDAEGSLHSHGALEPAAGHVLRTDLALDLKNFAWHQYQADSLEFGVRNMGSADRASLRGVNLVLPGVNVALLEAQATGTVQHHLLDLAIDSDRGALRLSGSGGYGGLAWQGTLSRVDVTPAGAAEWHAAAPWSLKIAPHSFTLPRACLVQAAAHACLDLGIDPQGWHGDGSLQQLPLAALQTILPKGLEYIGTLDATLEAAGDSHRHHIRADAALSPGSVRDLRGGRSLTLLAYTGGEAHMQSDPGLTSGLVHWSLSDGGNLQVDTRVSGAAQTKLSGHIRGELRDFALLPALVPEVSKASGRLTLDITLAGSPLEPSFSGSSALSDGAVSIPRLGIDVTGLQFTLAGDGRRLDLAGSVNSGRGQLRFHANGGRENGVWHAIGSLQGANFRAVDTTEAQVDLSPDLHLALDDHDLHADGDVTVPHAVLKPRNLTGSVQVSPDQVLVGETGGPPQERWHLYSKIQVVLGSGVYFDGFGLNGDISGHVLADTEPGHPTTASGELAIADGSYTAEFGNLGSLHGLYKQKLAIDYGRLMFTGGPITDPALDIRAARAETPTVTQFGTVQQKVGLLVRGLLDAPDITLWSDPPLPQAQLVSYLLTGNPNSFEGGGGTLGNSTPGVVTASSLSGPSAQSNQDMTLHVGGGQAAFDVGYSQMQIAGGTVAQGLFVGKQLSPRIYVRYAQATNEPYNILQFIYKLGTQWMLQAQSGSASSADIIYTLEH